MEKGPKKGLSFGVEFPCPLRKKFHSNYYSNIIVTIYLIN